MLSHKVEKQENEINAKFEQIEQINAASLVRISD